MTLINAYFFRLLKSVNIFKTVLLLIILMVLIIFYKSIQNDENELAKCSGEKMAYELKINTNKTVYGRKFDCSFEAMLDNYRLSDKFAIREKIDVKHPGHPKFTFVTAANFGFWQNLFAAIAGIIKHFGCSQRIIVYDLGKERQTAEFIIFPMDDLCSVPNLEFRIFNFSQMQKNVQNLGTFSWKIFILSQMFTEFDTFLWVDTSIAFKSSNLTNFLVPMQKGIISDIQRPAATGHGINFATHSETFKFLPLYTNFVDPPQKFYDTDNELDPPMFQANFIIVHKSERTRKALKWALLCAAELKCIAPFGSTSNCMTEKDRHKANECHRQDQSVISIVHANMEYEQKQHDPSLLSHFDYSKHPMYRRDEGHDGLYKVQRGQFIKKSSIFRKRISC